MATSQVTEFSFSVAQVASGGTVQATVKYSARDEGMRVKFTAWSLSVAPPSIVVSAAGTSITPRPSLVLTLKPDASGGNEYIVWAEIDGRGVPAFIRVDK